MKFQNLLTASCLSLFCVTSANADTFFHNNKINNTIIELFTSQGCSSCPPAEKWLGEFKEDERLWKTLFPIAFHVDYWDYIGWQDIYADPAFSKRQKQYKKEKAISSVYTPGFVVNGKEWRGWFGWFGKKDLPETRTQGDLSLSFSDNLVIARYLDENLSEQELTLNIALLATGINTEIQAGENAGRFLPQDFTVLHHQSEKSSSGNWKVTITEFSFPDNSRPALVAWISGKISQQPLQVTGGWLE